MALRYYFDLVCPYSYILGFEVERAEDDRLAEIEWLPFELRPVPKSCPNHVAPTSATTGVTMSTDSPPHTKSRYTFRVTNPARRWPCATLVRRGRGAR